MDKSDNKAAVLKPKETPSCEAVRIAIYWEVREQHMMYPE
jgi:hypothetical protein